MFIAMAPLVGCGGDGGGPATESSGSTASAAPSNGLEISAPQMAERIDAVGPIVLDVRTPAEFEQGHLPGAVNIDVQAPDGPSHLARLDPGGEYAVYCRSGNRSGTAVEIMREHGITSTYHLAGGIAAWEAAGLAIVQ